MCCSNVFTYSYLELAMGYVWDMRITFLVEMALRKLEMSRHLDVRNVQVDRARVLWMGFLVRVRNEKIDERESRSYHVGAHWFLADFGVLIMLLNLVYMNR